MTDAAIIERILSERAWACPAEDVDPQLQALQTAILVEDVFDVVLPDEQLAPGVLSDEDSLRALILGSRASSSEPD